MRKTIFRIDAAGDKAVTHFTDGTIWMRKTISRIEATGERAAVHFSDGTYAAHSADVCRWIRVGDVAEVAEAEGGALSIVRTMSPQVALPMTLSERLERAARKADEFGLEFGARSSRSGLLNDEGVATFARLSLLMYAAAEIIRAARDPNEPLREEMLSERRDPV